MTQKETCHYMIAGGVILFTVSCLVTSMIIVEYLKFFGVVKKIRCVVPKRCASNKVLMTKDWGVRCNTAMLPNRLFEGLRYYA